MERLYVLLIGLFVIGCSDSSLGPQEDCFCGLDISSTLPQNSGMYELEYDSSLAQTYSVLDFQTECGWSQHIQWDSDHMYQIVPGQWTSIVNPASMTDEDGKGKIVFAVWEEIVCLISLYVFVFMIMIIIGGKYLKVLVSKYF